MIDRIVKHLARLNSYLFKQLDLKNYQAKMDSFTASQNAMQEQVDFLSSQLAQYSEKLTLLLSRGNTINQTEQHEPSSTQEKTIAVNKQATYQMKQVSRADSDEINLSNPQDKSTSDSLDATSVKLADINSSVGDGWLSTNQGYEIAKTNGYPHTLRTFEKIADRNDAAERYAQFGLSIDRTRRGQRGKPGRWLRLLDKSITQAQHAPTQTVNSKSPANQNSR